MSQFIQSKIELFHTFDEKTPTQSEDNTEPKLDQEEVGVNTKKGMFQARGIERKLGRTAVIRRSVGAVAQITSQAVDRIYSDKIFKANLQGDRRSMLKSQEQQSKLKGYINVTRGAIGAGITGLALSNPYIFGIFLANEVVSRGQMLMQQTQDLNHYNILREKEMFETRRRQDRLNIGTFNRRG